MNASSLEHASVSDKKRRAMDILLGGKRGAARWVRTEDVIAEDVSVIREETREWTYSW
jgi:hypothetical protein